MEGEPGDHGGLVQQILETQKELQHGNKIQKPVEIVSFKRYNLIHNLKFKMFIGKVFIAQKYIFHKYIALNLGNN